jgi:hypothetical protein
MQDLTAGWPMIRSNIPTFIVIVALIAGVAWGALSWSYGSIVRHQAAEIKLLERQKAEAAAISKPSLVKEGAPQAADIQRLVRDPRLEWESGGRVSLQGRFARSDGPVTIYVTYGSNGGAFNFGRAMSGKLAVEPRIKIGAIDHFDRDEQANFTIGYVTNVEGNQQVLQWGEPQQDRIKVGITWASYFCLVIFMWKDGKEDSYPFLIVARSTDITGGAPPVFIGPDLLAAHMEIDTNVKK